MAVEVKLDGAGVAALMVSQPMRAAMLAAGQEVAAEARRRMPRRTGALAASVRVEPAVAVVATRKGGPSSRASGRVIAEAPHAAAAEFGHLGAQVRGHAGFQLVVPGAHTLGRMAATKAARAARPRRGSA